MNSGHGIGAVLEVVARVVHVIIGADSNRYNGAVCPI